MSSIKEIRELTGLSQTRLADWLGVSKSLIQFAERGERSLNTKATMKLNAMVLLAQELKVANKVKPGQKAEFADPVKLAERHRKKMEFHQRSAASLRVKLRKLKTLHPQINSRLELLDAMKTFNTEWYSSTERDNTFIKMIEWFTKQRLPNIGLEEQDLLQDKIETHMAYAELHKHRWKNLSNL
jgi:transcriptional regulator with XRE-family HTH domain